MSASKFKQIGAEVPYESHFVTVKGCRLHYLDKEPEGGGETAFVFQHGNPTSSYLWRNVMPYLEPLGRVVAMDLPGFGKSDKPEMGYTLQEHIAYFDAFVEALALKSYVLVIHDWGSVIGFDHARRHADRVKGIAFMEAITPPVFPMPSIDGMPKQARDVFAGFRTPGKGEEMVLDNNMFVEGVLPSSILRDLSEEEMAVYRAPFQTRESRLPTLVFPREIPIGGEPARNVDLVETIGQWLLASDLPKLLLYATPGALCPPQAAEWLLANAKNLQARFVGYGSHFIQEDEPEIVGRNIADWYRGLR